VAHPHVPAERAENVPERVHDRQPADKKKEDKITHKAAMLLGRESKGESRMKLINEKGEEVSILVDGVNTIDRLGPGMGILPVADRPDVLLDTADAARLQGLLQTGWRSCEGRPAAHHQDQEADQGSRLDRGSRPKIGLMAGLVFRRSELE
jgi:hypothetical protein